MTAIALRSKAETALSEAFEKVERSLPGGPWLMGLRRQGIGAFQAQGLPHRRIEEWKYTDCRQGIQEAYPIAPVAQKAPVGLDGAQLLASLFPGLSASWVLIVDGASVATGGAFFKAPKAAPFLADHFAKPEVWIAAAIEGAASGIADGAMALNAAYMTDGVVLDIPDGADIAEPIVLLFHSSSPTPQSVFTRSLVRVGRGAKATIIEAHLGDAAARRQANHVVQIEIADGAELQHMKALDTHQGDVHIAKWQVRLGANVAYRPFQMTLGEGFVRNELAIAFDGTHSSFDLGAAFLMSAAGHSDTTMVVDHKVAHCTSRELVKGVLDGRGRGIFQGKVIVRPHAQKTDGKQMAQVLMLSPDAEFDSKPELEIYADDVVCGHGSTSAELDDDLLFYLRSRGIPLADARAMLITSFIGEAIDKVSHDVVREALMARALERLALSRG